VLYKDSAYPDPVAHPESCRVVSLMLDVFGNSGWTYEGDSGTDHGEDVRGCYVVRQVRVVSASAKARG
jgi:hypothetical protein